MSSITGNNIKISIFGQSHSVGLGVVIDGLPTGVRLDHDMIRAMIDRRRTGGMLTSKRREADEYEIISGVVDDVTCGAPLCAVFRNGDMRSGDYDNLRTTPRPAHADYTAGIRYNGYQDHRGGGHFSGRLTLPICFAGAICKQILQSRGIEIYSHVLSIGEVTDDRFSVDCHEALTLPQKEMKVISDEVGEHMKALVEEIRLEADSIGGVVECCVLGMPAGVGDPMFDSVESRLSSMMFSIPAVKGVEFGSGFDGSRTRGSVNNDSFTVRDGRVVTLTNNHGGILGGITSGMPITFRTAFKPTPSIGREQASVDLVEMVDKPLVVKGRHDPCIVLRATPVVECATAIVILDMITG